MMNSLSMQTFSPSDFHPADSNACAKPVGISIFLHFQLSVEGGGIFCAIPWKLLPDHMSDNPHI